MWVKVDGKHEFTAAPNGGPTDFAFFELQGVFALWFDSANSFKAYVYAEKTYKEQSSASLPIPIRSWINIQVVITQLEGLKVLVFDQQGVLFSSAVLPSSLSK